MSDKPHDNEIEIESLNLDNLDVEELEHRLEMAMVAPQGANDCAKNNGCYINT